MQDNICCVTYGELSNLVSSVISKIDNGCKFQIVEGLREETLELIDRAILDGAEAVIAGGANAQVIRGYFNIPVLEYKVTLLDYITAIHKGYSLGHQVVVVRYMTPMDEQLKACLSQVSMEVGEIVYEDQRDLEAKITLSTGDVFVGHALTVDVARKAGKTGVLLYSGESSIMETMEEARVLIRELRKEKEKNEFVKATMEYSPNGLIFLDGNLNIIDCNQGTLDLIENSGAVLKGRKLQEILAECIPEKREETGSQVIHLRGKKLLERWVPVSSGPGSKTGYMIIMTAFSDYKKAEMDYRKRRIEQRLERGFAAKYTFKDIIGSSYKMRVCLDEAELFAQSSAAVLLCGETGVGKELFAQSIHNNGLRKDGPFVAVNCAALPANLLESELFGYDEGAFTGGKKGGKKGLFELADGGTIFLDEIGEISNELQARLLRAIQEKEVMHVGGDRIIPVDVRIITATNRNLEQMPDQNFRKDLYYRLSVLELHIPPLRERENDVIELFEFYMKRKKRINAYEIDLTEDIKDILRVYSWKGNIRELQNVCERFCLYMERSVRFEERYAKRCMVKSVGEERLVQDLMQAYNTEDKKLIVMELKRLLSYSNEQISKILGVSRTTLWRLLNENKE